MRCVPLIESMFCAFYVCVCFICFICFNVSLFFNVCLSKCLVFPFCYTGTILDIINIKYRLITWVNDVDIDGLAESVVYCSIF